ncbi:MAG TPA: THUMP domain-containing protein [Candidatus Nanoarchaeia archaeon]|nr:THUMP domain-containing protein [Candidatus Nanoarchaeia archaeon]
MIRACAITDKGIEKITVLELDEIIKAKGVAEESVVLFECKDYDELFTFCYKAQSIERVLLLLDSFAFKNQEEMLLKASESLKKIELDKWFDKDKSFRVVCERRGEHAFGSQTIEEELGELIIKDVKRSSGFLPDVSMEAPDTIIYTFINNDKAYLGIDLAGRDLSKRKYRIFSAPGIINANLAYAIIRLSEYSPKEKMIDLFCKSGVVCIEAALYASRKSANYYSKDFAFKKLKPFNKKDWERLFKAIDEKAKLKGLSISGFDPMLRNVEASKKNAKLAGVDKIIGFSRMDVEWLDTKLEKNSVDCVISRISCPSKHVKESDIRKSYKELFYQAEFVVKKGGRLALLCENPSLLKEITLPAFKITKEDKLWAGKQKYELVMMKKA